MAYTTATQVAANGKGGVGVKLNSVKISATGVQTPFSYTYPSGVSWGQVTFQIVLGTVTVLTADLEFDMTGVDANFVAFAKGVDLFANPIQIFNLNSGNIRYRWNIKSLTDGGSSGVFIWSIAG